MRFPLSLFALLVLTACSVKDPKNPNYILAEGKGVKITRADLDAKLNLFLSRVNASASSLPPDQLAALEKRIVEQEVLQQLLAAKAKEEGLKPDKAAAEKQLAEFKKQAGSDKEFQDNLKKMSMTEAQLLENISNFTLINAYVQKKVPQVAEPKPEEAENFYKSNPGSFSQPEMVRASHILVKVDSKADAGTKAQKRKIIDAARARVTKGEDFAKVAAEVSEDPGSGKQGGDLNFFRRGEMVPEFDKTAFSSKVGTVSPVFETAFGYHFLKVTDRKDPHTVDFKEASSGILRMLKQQAQKRALDQFFATVQSSSKVEYHLPEPPKKEALPINNNIKVPVQTPSSGSK